MLFGKSKGFKTLGQIKFALNYFDITEPEYLKEQMIDVNRGSFGRYREIKDKYIEFATAFIERTEAL